MQTLTIQQSSHNELWNDFLIFKANLTSNKRKRIKTATPVFNYNRYNQLKQELNK